MKFTLARANRPRNPMVAPALFRQAGRHRGAAGRPQDQRALAREVRQSLDTLHDAPTPMRTPPDPYRP